MVVHFSSTDAYLYRCYYVGAHEAMEGFPRGKTRRPMGSILRKYNHNADDGILLVMRDIQGLSVHRQSETRK
jgi:hypothetical protein